MTDYVRQHAVPAAYLKNFCEDGKPYFWVYEHDAPFHVQGTAFKGYPKSFTRKDHRYSVPDLSGQLQTEIEQEFLAPIDNRGMAMIRSVLTGKIEWSQSGIRDFARYVACQHLRSDRMIDHLHRQVVDLQKQIEGSAAAGAVTGFDLRREKPLVVVAVMEAVEKLAMTISNMHWDFATSAGDDFVSSSSPCVVDFGVKLGPMQGGLLHPKAHLSLPLGPKVCFAAIWPPEGFSAGRLSTPFSKDEVRSMNRIRASHSDHILGRDRAQVEDLGRQFRKP
jgi:hypothetical protein